MLHLLIEDNSELKNRVFPLPREVRKLLQKTLNNYKGDKTIEGYKRLNNLLSMENISYRELKRIKNFFDNFRGTEKSTEFILNGGEPMKNWVNSTLNIATKQVHDFKQSKKDAGIDNAFRKSKPKDRQNKTRKPTQVTFNTSNKNLLNNDILKFENLLRESLDIEDMIEDYNVNYVLNSFFYKNEGTQNWGVLINPSMYQKALAEFTKFGKLVNFPTRYIYQWIGIIFRNTCILEANTLLAGHGNYFPIEDVEPWLEEKLDDKFYEINNDDIYIKLSEKEFLDLCSQEKIYINESNGIHKDGQYDLFMNQEEVDDYDIRKEQYENDKVYIEYQKMAEEFNKKSVNYYGIQTKELGVNVKEHVIYEVINIYNYLDEIGLYDWMKMPDGSDAWSDFGLEPLFKLLNEYNDDLSPEETLVLINKLLDVSHMRGDIPSIFIQGGSRSLSNITNGNLYENRQKIIVITKKQKKMLKEALKKH